VYNSLVFGKMGPNPVIILLVAGAQLVTEYGDRAVGQYTFSLAIDLFEVVNIVAKALI